MLTEFVLHRILTALPTLRIGVVGDLFLDRYLDLDARLTEPSLETGLDAYQVVGVRSSPGAAGTILNNLVALGVGRVAILSVVGQDGEGYELRRELDFRGIDSHWLLETPDRRTPTYTKPMLQDEGQPPRELNRIDIKNRTPLPLSLEKQLIDRVAPFFGSLDAMIVLDQVSEPECGVVTTAVRQELARLGAAHPAKVLIADSRQRIGLFRNVIIKPNAAECIAAAPGSADIELAGARLADAASRPVFCTNGRHGMVVIEPGEPAFRVPAFPVDGPIDPVGAGDSVNAALGCALAAGRTLAEAAAFGNLVASITIQQLGTTGTATPAQVWERWESVGGYSCA